MPDSNISEAKALRDLQRYFEEYRNNVHANLIACSISDTKRIMLVAEYDLLHHIIDMLRTYTEKGYK